MKHHLNTKLGVVFFALLLLSGTQALAKPHFIRARNDVKSFVTTNTADTGCLFPDNTNKPMYHCYTIQQMWQAYGIDKLRKQGLSGKAQTIVLVESYGSPTAQKDLDIFSDAMKVPRAKIQFLYPNGPYTNPMTTPDQESWAFETTLDLQWAHAIAPRAQIVDVVTSSDEVAGMVGLADIFQGVDMAIDKYPGCIISLSLGTGESTFTAAEVETYLHGKFHHILEKAVRAGVTVLVSTGDHGTTNLDLAQDSFGSAPSIQYPAADPLVTSVGGTWLQIGWKWNPTGTGDDYWNCFLSPTGTDCDPKFLSAQDTPGKNLEVVWKEDYFLAATGGGVSTVFKEPFYQSSLSKSVKKQLNGQRGIPDIAMNAAVDGGVMVYTSDPASPGWTVVGGTSAAAPEMAGLVALAGQSASDRLHYHVSVGFLNPQLYRMSARNFNDIVPQTFGDQEQVTLDNNAPYFNIGLLDAYGPTTVPPMAIPGMTVTKGYDLTTGLGSPKAFEFVNDLADVLVFDNYSRP